MKKEIEYAEQLLKQNPEITPEEMLHEFHITNYDIKRSIFAVCTVRKCELNQMCGIAIKEYKQPLISKQTLKEALLSCEFLEKDIEQSITSQYPDNTRYACVFQSKNKQRVSTKMLANYNVGNGDFTVECWIKPNSGGGTMISRKATEGGYNNGGFLFVLKPDGVLKLATDDGMGFYEINTSKVNAYDGKYHHVLGLRRGDELEIYFDFCKVQSSVRTNRFSKLNINNCLGITIGSVEQNQEPYNYFNGNIGECRIWKIAKTYKDRIEWENIDYINSNLIGMWGFWNKLGEDYSSANTMNVDGCQFEAWKVTT